MNEFGYRNHHPCMGCGASGVQVWLRATDNLCLNCRGKQVETALTKPNPNPPESHAATLANYISPEAQAFVIETQEQAQVAAELVSDVARRAKELKDAEKELLKDFEAGIAKIKARFRPLHDAAAEAVRLWKGKILDSERRRREETTRALQAAQSARQAGNQEAVVTAVMRIQPVEKLQGVTKQKIWKYRITDEAQIPREYLTVNTALLQRCAKDHPDIPGVEFYQEEILRAC